MGISLDALMDIQRETIPDTHALPSQVCEAITALDKFKASIVVELPRLYHSDEYSALNIRIRKALADMNKIADDPNQLRNALNLDVEKVPLSPSSLSKRDFSDFCFYEGEAISRCSYPSQRHRHSVDFHF